MKKKKFIEYILAFLLLVPSVIFSYDREQVRIYLSTYAYTWNTHYNYYGDTQTLTGTDCANFASQVLIAGCYSETLKNTQGTERWCFPTCDKLDAFLKTLLTFKLRSIGDCRSEHK